MPNYINSDDVCIYAAGVSNSSCENHREFLRERQRLEQSLKQAERVDAFVYFGTCSIADPELGRTPYVQHKQAMEQLVITHPRHMILRLPQLAGKTPNPHTLLNYLYARISRGEVCCVWRNAWRNIIDVEDAAIAYQVISDASARNITISIANPVSYPLPKIIRCLEFVIGKRANLKIIERGSYFHIDSSLMIPFQKKAAVEFGDGYLEQVIAKYYGSSRTRVGEF